VARRLAEEGHRCWMVGGGVRDLALSLPVHDVDLASSARPETIERIFERTHPVGKAFGTMLVVVGGHEMQVTTFRADGAYSDARRPDEVVFGTSLELDARRRDFTCNALYLDPLTDELADPEGGLEDLDRRVLRCVGDADRRFREDGLRLLRMARFAAVYALDVDPDTLRAAREGVDSLHGVSPERIFAELAMMAERGAAAPALRLLAKAGVLVRALPGLDALRPAGQAVEAFVERRLAVLDALGEPADLTSMLAVLLDPLDPERERDAVLVLEGLHPPRALVEGVKRLWRLLRGLAVELAREGGDAEARAARIRLVRAPEWESLVALGRAWSAGKGAGEPLTRLVGFAESLAPEELRPKLWIESADLAAAGIPRGPHWGTLLREAEGLQLGGAHRTREQALRWLEARARELRD